MGQTLGLGSDCDMHAADTVYQFYGLAFFVLGLAIAVRVAPAAASRVRGRILALAAFGLIHAVHEWMHLSEFQDLAVTGERVRLFAGLLSFLALAYFALGWRKAPLWAWALAGCGVVTLWLAAAIAGAPSAGLEVLIRWGLAAPTALAAGLALLFDPALRPAARDTRWHRRFAAGVFFVYAGLQLFASPADFFPASVFNTARFEAVTGVSVLVLRGACAAALTVGMLSLLAVFDEVAKTAAQTVAERAEARVEENRRLVATVFDLAPIGLLIVRVSDGLVIAVNQALMRSANEFGNALVGVPITAFTSGEARASVEAALTAVKTTGASDAQEIELRRRDGVGLPVRFEGVGTIAPDGETLAVFVAQDITEQKRTQAVLRRQQALAEQASVAKSDFMATMSHELRTPLNGVLGMLELIDRAVQDAKLKAYVHTAKSAGKALLRQVEDLLDFETLEGGRLRFEAGEFSIDALLEIAVAPARIDAERKDLNLDVSADPDVCFRGDVKRVGQILGNLVSNAIKFTDAGQVQVEARAARGGLALTVRDTGIGMSEAFQADAFARFTQSDGSLTRRHEGAGLGLAIVKGIVDALDGQISLTSAPGEGTTVQVFLPLEQTPCSEAAGAADVSSAGGLAEPARRLRILIAEDNASNRETIAAMLDDDRYDLTFSADGEAALELAKSRTFDLWIFDIQMPKRTGDDVLKALQETDAARCPPAIACTAHAYRSEVEAYLNAGFDAVITKPIDLDELEATIDRLIANTDQALSR